jgi:hypothetical protein
MHRDEHNGNHLMSYLGLQPNTPLLNTSTQFFSGNSVATQFTLARSGGIAI